MGRTVQSPSTVCPIEDCYDNDPEQAWRHQARLRKTGVSQAVMEVRLATAEHFVPADGAFRFEHQLHVIARFGFEAGRVATRHHSVGQLPTQSKCVVETNVKGDKYQPAPVCKVSFKV